MKVKQNQKQTHPLNILPERILTWIQQVVLVTDTNGIIIFANDYVEKVFGFSPDEIKGQNLSVIFMSEDLEYMYPNLLYIARKKGSFEGELMLVRKNGASFFAFMAFTPFSRMERSLIAISIQDIDRRRQLENSFSGECFDELMKIAKGIAHEIRNPLSSIGGFVDRLYRSCRINDKHDKYHDHILYNLKKIEGLIKNVEFFVKLPKPCFHKKQMNELIGKAVEPYRHQLAEKKIELQMEINDTVLSIDPDLFLRTVSILIENSIDAIKERGSIGIQGKARDDHYLIDITDTGSGISDDDLPYIFNPFFSTKPDGAGIDLSVVKRIMNSHGGSVDVKSTMDKGTSFILSFPFERRRPIRVASLEV